MNKTLQEIQEDEDFCGNCQKELDSCRCECYQDKCEAVYDRYLDDYYGGSGPDLTLDINKTHK